MHNGCSLQMFNGKSRCVQALLNKCCSVECCLICSDLGRKRERLVFFWEFKAAGLWQLGVVWLWGECKRWSGQKKCNAHIVTWSQPSTGAHRLFILLVWSRDECHSPMGSVSVSACMAAVKQHVVIISWIIIESAGLRAAAVLAKRKEELSNHESFLFYTIFSWQVSFSSLNKREECLPHLTLVCVCVCVWEKESRVLSGCGPVAFTEQTHRDA